MSWRVKVRIDGEVREIEVTAAIVEDDNCIHQEARRLDSIIERRPDWSRLLPGYRVHEIVGGADGVEFEAFRLGGNR